MNYVYPLTPEHYGYQMINENDFVDVFAEIEKIADDKPTTPVEEGVVITKKVSTQSNTKDTGSGTFFGMNEVYEMLDRH